MASRHKTGDAVSRLPALSRRAVLGGVSASPVLAGAPPVGHADPIVAISQSWLAVDSERNRLGLAWGVLEGELFKSHQWHRLSKPECDAIPEGRPLAEMSARLAHLANESERILDALPKAKARTFEGVLANLTIAMTLLYPEDCEIVHGLIMRAIADIRSLAGQP
jgi:hypothetical protein